jgi:hypothetical protein
LADWFTKSLLPKISCDVAMSGAVTEEDVIRRAQHLDLIYSQSGTLYDIIPNAPRPSNDTSRTTPGPHADGVIGSISTTSVSQVAGQLGQLALTDKPTAKTPATTSSDPAPSTDVTLMQTSKSSRRKNRNQQRKESSGEQEEATPKEAPSGKKKNGKKKVKFPCLACKEEDHFTRDCPRLADVQKFVEQSKNPPPAMLTNPFPAQHQQLIAKVPAQQPTQQNAPPPSGASSSSIHIMMADTVDLATRAKNYEKQPEGESSAHVNSPSQPQSHSSLTFEKPTFEAPSRPSKGTLRRTHNLNAWAAQHYSIIEDLTQAPCAMSALEVLQSCPSQRKALLQAIGAVNSADTSLLSFDHEHSEPRLPHSITLQISMGCLRKQVHRTMLDEGAATCIMSFTCWQALGSPTLATSQTILKALDGHLFSPHGILSAFPIELGGKIVTVEVEVVNAPLDYNLLLGRSWFYPMRAVASTVYRLVRFPHQGKIVSIDQLDYCSPNVRFDATTNIPLVNSHAAPSWITVPPVPDVFVAPIHMISSVGIFVGNPWILPSPAEAEQYGDNMSLSPAEKTYSAIQSESISPIFPPSEDVLDIYSLPEWAAIPSSSSHDFLNDVLLSDEAIIEAMTLSERPWEDHHHRSSVLPPLHDEDSPLNHSATEDGPSSSPTTSYCLPTERNLSNIAKTITIDISVKTSIVEAITIGANSTQQEILNYKALFIEFRDIFA